MIENVWNLTILINFSFQSDENIVVKIYFIGLACHIRKIVISKIYRYLKHFNVLPLPSSNHLTDEVDMVADNLRAQCSPICRNLEKRI